MANIWRNPIFDRTSADVAFALQQIAAWKQSHTHSGDVVVEADKLAINGGEVATGDDSVVWKTDGITYVEDDALVVQFGIVHDLKGCLNLSDITRIEDNISYLTSRLTQYRYSLDVNTKEWTKDSLPTAQDMKRIGTNIRSLINKFAKSRDSVTVPDVMLSYEDINALELNLYLLKQLLDAMVLSFIKSNTYKSGATMRLPIRR